MEERWRVTADRGGCLKSGIEKACGSKAGNKKPDNVETDIHVAIHEKANS